MIWISADFQDATRQWMSHPALERLVFIRFKPPSGLARRLSIHHFPPCRLPATARTACAGVSDEELPEPQQQRYKRQKIERWLDAGLGCCALAHPGMAAVMRDTLIYQNGRRYHLLAWCIMPNHVHALIEPARSLPRIVQGWSRILPAGCWRIMSGSGWACQGGVCGCGITGTASSGTSDIWKRLFIIFIRTRLRRGCARRLRNGVGRVRFGRRGRRRSA